MKHQIIVRVTEPGGKKNTVFTGQKIKFPIRLIKQLFCKGQKMLVLVPGETVDTVEIKEVEDDESTKQNAC